MRDFFSTLIDFMRVGPISGLLLVVLSVKSLVDIGDIKERISKLEDKERQ